MRFEKVFARVIKVGNSGQMTVSVSKVEKFVQGQKQGRCSARFQDQFLFSYEQTALTIVFDKDQYCYNIFKK